MPFNVHPIFLIWLIYLLLLVVCRYIACVASSCGSSILMEETASRSRRSTGGTSEGPALAAVAGALRGPIGADIAHILVPAEQVDGGMTAECAGPLDAPAEHWAQAQHPGFQGLVSIG